MKKYILTVFAEVSRYEVCKEIVMSIVPIVDSQLLKYQKTHGAIVFHFASEIDQDELVEYIESTISDYSNSFIMSEYSDKMSLVFPPDILEHLLNLEDSDEDSIEVENLEDEQYVEETLKIINEIKKNIVKPTLDSLLDKIQDMGIESLSPFEKDVLEEYSKK